jgi:hypothetical protein
MDSDNLVNADDFRADFDRYIAAAKQGCGPVAVTRDSEILGFFVGPADYEAMFGAAVRQLLSSRADGPSVSHAQARARIDKAVRRVTRRS